MRIWEDVKSAREESSGYGQSNYHHKRLYRGPQKITLVEISADGGLEDLKRWGQWFFRAPLGCRKRGSALIGCRWFQPAPDASGQSACADPLQGEAAQTVRRRHRLNSSKRIPQPPHLEAQLPHQRIESRQRDWQYCDSLLVCDSGDHCCSFSFLFLKST